MRELDRIQQALAAALTRGDSAMLVTVLGVEGSVYRGAGARMVISSTGEAAGAVSGGCLEADIVARAPDVLAEGQALVVRYDTRASDDVVLGLGLGCQGIIDVLLEPLVGAHLAAAVGFYQRLATRREAVAMLTFIGTATSAMPVGARVVFDERGDYLEGDRRITSELVVAREFIRPATPLVICGGGNDAVPLARLAKHMGWHVTIIDHRSSFATRARFPDADAVVCANLAQDGATFPSDVQVDPRTVAVVMAHSASHDRAYLHAMLDTGARYIGVLGPLRRTLELLGARALDSKLPSAVHAPIGLDIGAELPEEIALAIVAEVAAVTSGRGGGMLRNRDGPIHEDRHGLPGRDSLRG